MSKITVWNPWKITPRDFFNFDSDMFPVVDDVEMDMYETKDSFVVKVKAAGYDKDSLDIDIKNNRLTISGKAHEEKEEDEKEKKYYFKEIKSMSFSRSVDLPVSVKSESADAEFKNGVLIITLPKSEEAQSKKIAVK